MSNDRRPRGAARGFTLLETIMAIVIIGVGVAGVLSVFNVNVRHSFDPVVRKQLMAIAEEMLEEIALRPFVGPTIETSAACGRANFDDLRDYHLYPTNHRVCDVEGVPIAALANYWMEVRVTDVTLDTVPARRIEVEVRQGDETLTLVTWRTNFAGTTP